MSRNTKTFFQMLSSSREAKEKIPDAMTLDGVNLNTKEDINKGFHKYFTSNMTKNDNAISRDEIYDIFVEYHQTERENIWDSYIHAFTEEIAGAVSSLNPNKSPGRHRLRQ